MSRFYGIFDKVSTKLCLILSKFNATDVYVLLKKQLSIDGTPKHKKTVFMFNFLVVSLHTSWLVENPNFFCRSLLMAPCKGNCQAAFIIEECSNLSSKNCLWREQQFHHLCKIHLTVLDQGKGGDFIVGSQIGVGDKSIFSIIFR